MLESNSENDKIRQIIRDQVSKTNWRKDVQEMSGKIMTPDVIEELTPEIVAEKIKDKAIANLPKNLNAVVEKYIKEVMEKTMVPVESPAK